MDGREIGVNHRNGVAIGKRAVELEHHVLRIERQIRRCAHQAGIACGGGQPKELHLAGRLSRKRRRHHHQGKVQVSHRKANGAGVGGLIGKRAVVVAVGDIGAVDTGKRADVQTGNDQGVPGHADGRTGQFEVHRIDDAFLEGEAAFQVQHACNFGHRVSHCGADDFVGVVQQHRRGRVASGHIKPCHFAAAGEVSGKHFVAAGVDIDDHIVERELEGVADAHQANLVGRGAQGSELGAHHQIGQGRIQVRLGFVDTHAKAEVVHHKTHGPGVDRVRHGDDAVSIGVRAVRPACAHESLHVARTDGHGVGFDVVDGAQGGVGCDLDFATFLEGKRARDVDKL